MENEAMISLLWPRRQRDCCRWEVLDFGLSKRWLRSKITRRYIHPISKVWIFEGCTGVHSKRWKYSKKALVNFYCTPWANIIPKSSFKESVLSRPGTTTVFLSSAFTGTFSISSAPATSWRGKASMSLEKRKLHRLEDLSDGEKE